MADARVTQQAALAIEEGSPDARVTQQAALVLEDVPAVDARTTQQAALALSWVPVGAQVTQQAALALCAHTPCLTQRAQCWAILRADGAAHYFTTHDQQIAFGGQTYTPCASLSPSASDNAVATTGGSSDTTVTGILSEDYISAHDVAGGLYDNARVEVWDVPWAGDDMPRLIIRGVLSETTQGAAGYTATILSASTRLAQKPLLETYTPACRARFGDTRCKFDAEALRVSGSVTAITTKNVLNRARRRLFTDSARAEADGFYALGELTWVTGSNAGIKSEVKTFSTGGAFELWEPALDDIQIGDTYSLIPGCAKTKAACIAYANLDNFRGFPDIPGQDVLIRTPNAK